MPRSGSRALTRLNTLFSRDELSIALSASTDPKERQLGELLSSPDDRFTKLTVAGLASRLGLSHSQIMTAYRQYKRAEAIVEVARRAPEIVRDIAADALNKEVTCQACKGSGRLIINSDQSQPITTEICIPCEGSGKVIRHGDPVARKQALEMLELTGKAPTMIDARGGQMVVATEGSLEETLKQMRSGNANGRSLERSLEKEAFDVEGVVGGAAAMDGADAMEDSEL